MSEDFAGLNTAIQLAKQRNWEAANRTLMAWIRTSLTLVGFGFGIGKIHHFLGPATPEEAHRLILSSKAFGGAFIALGTFGLLAAAVQHWHTLKRIKREEYVYAAPWPLTEVVAMILFFIGLFALVELLL
jgi:putative membrane protein